MFPIRCNKCGQDAELIGSDKFTTSETIVLPGSVDIVNCPFCGKHEQPSAIADQPETPPVLHWLWTQPLNNISPIDD
jgi:hypothetical protein